jgi:ABC-2 type transport system ATP-binding protein
MDPILRVRGLTKTFASGLQALRGIDLDIRKGEIFALLGPNGAGKTTLISAICGIVTASAGTVEVDGHDIVRDYRAARACIGLVPQELHVHAFETVWASTAFTRGLFGLAPDRARLERLLRDLTLWDKRDEKIMALSGGMKRRLMIAKALAHEPRLLFLDEPTAGVDVELRRDMWQIVRGLRDSGVTVILTTHYIEEAEEMADRVGIIHRGELVRVQDKGDLLRQLGRKELLLELSRPLAVLPDGLAPWQGELRHGGGTLAFALASAGAGEAIPALLARLAALGIGFTDLATRESSLEEIFVDLVRDVPPAPLQIGRAHV